MAVLALTGADTRSGETQEAAETPAFVSLDEACIQEADRRHARLSRHSFGLPGELYLQGIRRKLERTYGLYQPRAPEGAAPGGRITLEVVIGGDGRLCGYRSLTPDPHPALLRAAARHLEANAPFPPLPPDIREAADAVHLQQSWAYTPRGTSPDARHRLQLYGGGSEKHQSGGARYELAVPLP